MLRPYRARGVLFVSLLLAAGCQNYNFNPVGHCLIQPGAKRVTLSNVSTADVLFVVDESGSMGGEQAALAGNFDAFITNLDAANAARASAGLEPIDFHLAVTTTSVFWNAQTTSTCRTDCPGATGQAVCCTSGNAPARQPKACTLGGPAGQCPDTTSCRLDCNRLAGAPYCCDATGAFPAAALSELVSCSPQRVGTMCGTLETHYDLQGCPSPIATNEWPFPDGDFVSRADSALTPSGPGPRVVHFDKELYRTGTNKQGFSRQQLVDFFKENVQVGTCGSGQEQALQAARRALEKALAGQQRDTFGDTSTTVWTPPAATQLPTTVAARWPTQGAPSKVVLVFVGDEDDCSSPADPTGGVVMLSEAAGADACVRDGLSTTDASIRSKEYPVQDFVSYFTSLGRPVAAGFILPAAQNSCTLDTCTTAGLCCGPAVVCSDTVGAQAPGARLLATAKGLAQAGVEVVAGSICDPNFGTILNDIAEIVKPPSGLTLPTLPAENDVTLLRIVGTDGTTRKVCGRPLAPRVPAYTLPEAQATGADWWFTESGDPGVPAEASPGVQKATQFVFINPKGSCVANPGETYSADYLGRVPEGGCWNDPRFTPAPGETAADAMCRQTLGGEAESWTCFAGVASPGVCAVPTSGAPGTCLCGKPRDICK